MQMGALTLKLTENINRIDDLIEVDKIIKKDIADNSNLINSNKDIIESKLPELERNLILFNTNLTKFVDLTKGNIKVVENNVTDIDNDKTKIDIIEQNISNMNLSIDKISTIENNVTKNYNITQIFKNKSEFNTDLIDNHTNTLKTIKNDIDNNSNNIDNINSNLSDIESKISNYKNNINSNIARLDNLNNYYNLNDIIMYDILKTYVPEDVNINNPKFTIIQTNLNNFFKKDSFLEFKSSILIFFNKHYINKVFFHLLLEYCNDDKLFELILMPLASGNITNFVI